MLKLFGGGRPDHPMADPKQARRLLEDLPPRDPLKALEELAHWHESVSLADGFRAEQRLQRLFAIDDAAQPRVRALAREYVAAVRPSRLQENRLWMQVHEYWRYAGQSYARAIDAALRGDKADDPGKAQLPLALRALRSLAQQIKWQHVRYGPIDGALWGALYRAYAFAEGRQLAEAPGPLYPGDTEASTPRREFMKALLLSASSPDSLLPAEIELAERLIGELGGSFALAPSPAPELRFWVDLAQPVPPQRALRAPPQSMALRCFGPGASLGTLHEWIERLGASGQAPASLSVAQAEPQTLLAVMRHLALAWSPVSPERQHARHSVKSRLSVEHGLRGVLAALGASGPREADLPAAESWIVENVSAGGFGARVMHWKGDWLKVGALLAMQPEGGSNWVVGIVRRLNKLPSREARVGIQTLSRAPAQARFSLRGAGASPGVLLGPANASGEVGVALTPGFYAAGQNLEAELGGRHHVYLPVRLAERGEDFEIVRFRELVREA